MSDLTLRRRHAVVRGLAQAMPSAWREACIPLAVVAVALALFVPLPAAVIDAAISASLAASVIVLVAGLRARGAASLTVLPSAEVLLALLRLAVGIAAARWVALHGFGTPLLSAVARFSGEESWSDLLGLAVVLGGIQVAVVSAGASRAAEVAARFALDALPLRQARQSASSTDAPANTDTRLQTEAGFYAAMDGATRLLRGEVFGLALIMLAGAAGGLARAGGDALSPVGAAAGIGVLLLLGAALSGAAAAIAVMRGSATRSLASEARAQLLAEPWPLLAGGAFCLALALWPAHGAVPAALVGAALLAGGVHLGLRARSTPIAGLGAASGEERTSSPLRILLGLGLLDLLRPEGGDLLDRLADLRQELSAELGFPLPGFTISDSIDLAAAEYALEIRGAVVSRGAVRPSRVLALAPPDGATPALGEAVRLSDGALGVWVSIAHREAAVAAGCAILSPADVLLHEAREAVRSEAADLFDRQQAADMLGRVARTHPAVVRAAVDAGVDEGTVMAVGQALLEREVPLHAPVALIDGLAQAAGRGAAFDDWVSAARGALTHVITKAVAPDGELFAVEMGAALQDELGRSLYLQGDRLACGIAPDRALQWRRLLQRVARDYAPEGRRATILCAEPARRALTRLLADMRDVRIAVVEPREILAGTRLQTVHRISESDLNQA